MIEDPAHRPRERNLDDRQSWVVGSDANAVNADPRNRQQVRHPSGWVGPAFAVGGLLVWGFTAGLIDKLLRVGGWEQPWTPGKINELPELRTDAETYVGVATPPDGSVGNV